MVAHYIETYKSEDPSLSSLKNIEEILQSLYENSNGEDHDLISAQITDNISEDNLTALYFLHIKNEDYHGLFDLFLKSSYFPVFNFLIV